MIARCRLGRAEFRIPLALTQPPPSLFLQSNPQTLSRSVDPLFHLAKSIIPSQCLLIDVWREHVARRVCLLRGTRPLLNETLSQANSLPAPRHSLLRALAIKLFDKKPVMNGLPVNRVRSVSQMSSPSRGYPHVLVRAVRPVITGLKHAVPPYVKPDPSPTGHRSFCLWAHLPSSGPRP
ncbi:hypothetical protein LX36DRAFT_211030 [Colletotrichum falcatum]|nr:hypothetical protein LX36DRAFT_211030 [Colletotrichum falcatum]